MQSISAKLDWNRILGFDQIASDRKVLRESGRLDPKVGLKVGVKLGLKVGIKN